MVRKKRILIVDDDRHMGETLRDILIEAEYEVVVVQTGLAAMDAVREKGYDLILLDFKMSGMDGLDTFREIKRIREESLIIMMTAFAPEDIVKICISDDTRWALYRDFDPEKILMQIKEEKNGFLVMITGGSGRITEEISSAARREEYDIVLARDREEALLYARAGKGMTVLYGATLPVLNALEKYVSLKHTDPRIGLIIPVTYREESRERVVEILKEERYTCIYKPFHLDYVLYIIQEVIAR